MSELVKDIQEAEVELRGFALHFNRMPHTVKVFEQIITTLQRAREALSWIPVETEKPSEDESVLLYGNHKWGTFFTVGHYSPDSDSWNYDDGTPCSPTHWMRAPEAPEAK